MLYEWSLSFKWCLKSKLFFTSRGGLRCLRTHLTVDRCHTNRVWSFFTSRGTDRQDSGRGVAGNRIVNTDLKNIGMIKEENRILIKLVVKILPKSLQLVTTHPSTLSRNQDSDLWKFYNTWQLSPERHFHSSWNFGELLFWPLIPL